MHNEGRIGHYLNIFFGEHSLKNKSFSVQQGDYNSNTLVCNLYGTNEKGRSEQIDLTGKTVTAVFKRENGKPTPEYTTEIDDTNVGRVSFCIPHRILSKPGDAMVQLKLYGETSLLNSVVLPFEIRKSIDNDCGHEDGCKPVTLHVIQKVEDAIDDMQAQQVELYEAEEDRMVQFREWQKAMDELEASETEIINKPTRYDFPSIGDEKKIYKAQAESKLYQWNAAEMKYEPLAFEEGTTDNITLIHGGNANGTA